MTMKTILGFDIGGTKCAVSIGKGTLEPGREAIDVIDRVFFLTAECKTPEETVDRACREMKMLIDKYGENNIASVGISCGGPLDGKKGMVLSPPNLPGWTSFRLCGWSKKRRGSGLSFLTMRMLAPWRNGNSVRERAAKTWCF